MSRYDNLNEALQWAAERGISLNEEAYEAIAEAERRTRARLAESRSLRQTTFVQRFNESYPKFLRSLHGTGEVILTISQTLIVAFGVPLALVLMLFVEQQRVRIGIGLFEQDAVIAVFASAALVLVNLVVEFIVEYIESQSGYFSAPSTKFSLRSSWGSFLYAIGLNKGWQPIALSPAQRFRILRRIITWSILSLALAGSMRDVIAIQGGSWLEALGNVLFRSTLSQASSWFGGVMFALAAVLTAQGLSRYVAVRCAEILKNMQSTTVQDTQKTVAENDAIESEISSAAAAALVAWAKTQHHAATSMPEMMPASFQQVSAVSGNQNFQQVSAVSGNHKLGKQEAVDILLADPSLMNRMAKDIMAQYGGSEATWSRAKQIVSAQSTGNTQ